MRNNRSHNEQKGENSSAGREKPFFLLLVEDLVSAVPKRSQDIVKKRFGLIGSRGETLEKIGADYGITRERVRQIVSDVVKNVAGKFSSQEFRDCEEKLVFTIAESNGIIKEDMIGHRLGLSDQREINAVRLLAEVSRKIFISEDKGYIVKSWTLSKDIFPEVKGVILAAEQILQKEQRVFNSEQIVKALQEKFPKKTSGEILAFLETSAKIKKNRFGKWGMYNWNQINPKGTREKIYLVLKEKRKPLHFTEIANLIDEYKIGKRKAHPQTVHNELIKDDRFVLIGRGIYALSEWGYSEGTIKEVLKNILSEAKRPMEKEEILKQVFKVRQVKKATVMINLNNSKVFVKANNQYSVRKN